MHPIRQSYGLLVWPPCPLGNGVHYWLGPPTYSAIVWIAGWAALPIRQCLGLLVGPPILIGNGVHCWLGPPSLFDNTYALHRFIRSHSIPALSPMLTYISNLFYLFIPSLTSHYIYFFHARHCASRVSHLSSIWWKHQLRPFHPREI